jgi:hypothetical protein
MPRTPTPPRLQKPREESVPKAPKQAEEAWADELPLGDLGDDPHPSPYERITVVPQVSEEEYVANMMRSDSVEAGPSSSERRREPRTGVTQILGTPTHPPIARPSDDCPDIEISTSGFPPEKSSSPVPPRGAAPEAPLTLDLFDPVLPAPMPFSMPPRTSSIPPWPSTPPPPPPSDRPGPSAQPPRASASPAKSSRPSAAPQRSNRPPEGGSDAFGDQEVQTTRRPSLTFGKATGDALELVTVRASSAPPAPATDITIVQIRDRFEVGDFSGALVMAEALLELDPENAEALLFAEHCRDVLKRMYLSRLGGVKRVPHISMTRDQQRWLSLDHRAGFVLSLVDGTSTIDEVLDISGMPELDALRILFELLQQNVIKVG